MWQYKPFILWLNRAIPSVSDNALSVYASLCRLAATVNQFGEEVNKNFEEIENAIAQIDDGIDDKIAEALAESKEYADKIVTDMQTVIYKYISQQIYDTDQKFMEQIALLTAQFNDSLSNLQNMLEQDISDSATNLQNQINDIKQMLNELNLDVYNPFTGEYGSILDVINSLIVYITDNVNGSITAGEFDAITDVDGEPFNCSLFDSIEMTAFDFDFNAKLFLYGKNTIVTDAENVTISDIEIVEKFGACTMSFHVSTTGEVANGTKIAHTLKKVTSLSEFTTYNVNNITSRLFIQIRDGVDIYMYQVDGNPLTAVDNAVFQFTSL